MRRSVWRTAVLAAAGVVLWDASEAWAWGGGVHIELAGRLAAGAVALPAGLAALLWRRRREFLYGNIAADVIFAKRLSRVKQFCHHWATGLSLLGDAETETGRAFAYGYLAHLAADTVAHNKYLPRQLMLSARTTEFGHLYWEIRADATVRQPSWRLLRDVLHHRHPEAERLMARHLDRAALPFGWNRRAFTRMNLLASARSWRQSVRWVARRSRYPLNGSLLAGYADESLARAADVLVHLTDSPVMQLDPSGRGALGRIRSDRRHLRRAARAGLPTRDILREMVHTHAPEVPDLAAG